MSADNSPESTSQPQERTRARQNSRYDRAAQEMAVTLPQERQQKRDATREQALADRQKRDEARAKLRGKAAELDDVAALFGAPKAQPNRSNGAGLAAQQDDDADAGDAGRPSTDSPPKQGRPALEFDDDDAGEDQPRRRKAKAIDDFVEEHGIKSAKAIYDLEVPLEEGQAPVTIGQLKDHFKETRDLELRRDEFETWRIDAQSEVMQARTKIEGVLARLPDYLPADVLARVSAQFDEDMAIQRERAQAQIREWFPEWRDVQVKARDREKLVDCLKTYGFSAAEVGNVMDARLIKFAIDSMRLMERHRRLREEWTRDKQPSKEPVSQRRERRISSTDRAKQIAASGDKVGAVSMLIGH